MKVVAILDRLHEVDSVLLRDGKLLQFVKNSTNELEASFVQATAKLEGQIREMWAKLDEFQLMPTTVVLESTTVQRSTPLDCSGLLGIPKCLAPMSSAAPSLAVSGLGFGASSREAEEHRQREAPVEHYVKDSAGNMLSHLDVEFAEHAEGPVHGHPDESVQTVVDDGKADCTGGASPREAEEHRHRKESCGTRCVRDPAAYKPKEGLDHERCISRTPP